MHRIASTVTAARPRKSRRPALKGHGGRSSTVGQGPKPQPKTHGEGRRHRDDRTALTTCRLEPVGAAA